MRCRWRRRCGQLELQLLHQVQQHCCLPPVDSQHRHLRCYIDTADGTNDPDMEIAANRTRLPFHTVEQKPYNTLEL